MHFNEADESSKGIFLLLVYGRKSIFLGSKVAKKYKPLASPGRPITLQKIGEIGEYEGR